MHSPSGQAPDGVTTGERQPDSPAVTAHHLASILFPWEFPAGTGEVLPPFSTIHPRGKTMLLNLLPSVSDFTLPDRIEIELRIEIER